MKFEVFFLFPVHQGSGRRTSWVGIEHFHVVTLISVHVVDAVSPSLSHLHKCRLSRVSFSPALLHIQNRAWMVAP